MTRRTIGKVAIVGAAATCFALLTGAAFGGWIGQEGDMLVSLAASGLSWCF